MLIAGQHLLYGLDHTKPLPLHVVISAQHLPGLFPIDLDVPLARPIAMIPIEINKIGMFHFAMNVV
jgi:hypothetical protein